MTAASNLKAGYEIGRAHEQQGMAQKHLYSVIGRPGWDGSTNFHDAVSATTQSGHQLNLAHDRHCELTEAIHDGDSETIKQAHGAMIDHLGKALTATKAASSVIDTNLRAHGDDTPEKPAGATNKTADFIVTPEGDRLNMPLLKGAVHRDGDKIRIFVPFAKVTEFKTNGSEALMVEGCASVADYLDDQNDIPNADALEAAMAKWAPFGNVRLQHKADKPVGTIRQPVIGELPDGVARPGYWMATHPVTGTKAAYIRVHVVDPETIKLIKAGVMTGFSIGGSVTDSRNVVAEVDDHNVVRGWKEVA